MTEHATSSTSLRCFRVGDRLIVVQERGTPREATVTKLGRKWATIEYDTWGEDQIEMSTGRNKPDYRGMSTAVAYTAEQFALKEELDALNLQLRPLISGYSWQRGLSSDQIRRLIALLEEPRTDDFE